MYSRKKKLQKMKMKNKLIYIAAFTFATLPAFIACSDDDDTVPKMVYPTQKGIFTDTRDGYVYHWVRYDTLDWMVDNGHYLIDDDAYCRVYSTSAGEGRTDYNDMTNWSKYGCLYTQSGAQMACPEGWRIPTDDDWQSLERYFGMSQKEAKAYNWRGMIAQNLMQNSEDSTTIHLQLGGFYAESWINWGSHMREWSVMGYYWTSTIDESKGNDLYFYRKIMWNKNGVYRQSTSPEDLFFSVRYVRRAE